MATQKNTKPKALRYDGAKPEVAEHIGGYSDHRQQMETFLGKLEGWAAQCAEAVAAADSLPHEINELLAGGVLDETTVEALARKRAHLDLVPGRISKLKEQHRELEDSMEFRKAWDGLKRAVAEAGELFTKLHLADAIKDYMALGVDEATAEEQAMLRPDISMPHDEFQNFTDYHVQPLEKQIRIFMGAFDCLAEGLSPCSEDAGKIKAKWVKD